MLNGLVSTDQLLAITGYSRAADLCRSLDRQGIRYFLGRGGQPWTTLDLLNAAGGLTPAGPLPAPMLGPDDA